MTDLDQIYSDRILALSASIGMAHRLPNAQASATANSKLCGSVVTVDLSLGEDGRVSEFGMEVKACLLGQASAAIMAKHIVGSTPEELKVVGQQMRAMLKENGPVPAGKWAELDVLESVRDYSQRHASALLVFDAVDDALSQISQSDVPAPETTSAPA